MSGRPANPIPLTNVKEVVKLRNCPDCDGRGWFLINPFATGGTNGLGGLGNMTQCETCARAHAYWNENSKLPEDVIAAMKAKGLEVPA